MEKTRLSQLHSLLVIAGTLLFQESPGLPGRRARQHPDEQNLRKATLLMLPEIQVSSSTFHRAVSVGAPCLP